MQIYLHHNGRQLGPFTEAEVRAQLASGAISVEDHVWWEGQANWMPLKSSPLMVVAFEKPPVPPATTSVPLVPLAATPGASGMSYADSVAIPQTCGLATASLVCALIGLPGLICGCVGYITFLPAVICGHLALAEIAKKPALQGRGMAIAGLVIGYIEIALTLLFMIGWFLFASLGGGMKAQIEKSLKEAQQQIQKDAQKDNGGSSDNSTNAPPVVEP